MSDELKKTQLRKHKMIATGLFLLMAVIYGLMVYSEHHFPQNWMGYVKAFSEAAMVGALADWFAVTALFRHPLGLPIPHTNLIERKKNDLGENLGKFVKDNFLNPTNIRPYIEKLDVVKIVANWLSKQGNQEVLEEETVHLLQKIIADLDDEDVEKFLIKKGEELLKSIDYQKIASSGITYALERNEHNRLLDMVLPEIKAYVVGSRNMIREKISENRPFIAFLAGKKISKELTEGILAFVEEIRLDPEHFVRIKLTEALEKLEADLLVSENWNRKFDALKAEILTSENLKPYVQDAWKAIKITLQENLEDSNSLLKEYLQKNIQKLSHNLMNDEALGHKINNWIRHFAYRMILKNRDEVEALISTTVSGWEGKELSNKLELEVGKDLQFIRINGTLVGGLVGLLIYIITHLVIQ